MKTSILVRFLFIPGGFKEYLLSATDLKFKHFLLSGIIGHFFYCLEATLIGKEFSTIQEFMNNPKAWSEKSLWEKFFFLTMILAILLTILVMTVLGAKFRSVVKLKKEISHKSNEVSVDEIQIKDNSF